MVLGIKPGFHRCWVSILSLSCVPSSHPFPFLSGFHYVPQAGCKHTLILLPQFPKYWESEHVPPYPASVVICAAGSVSLCCCPYCKSGSFVKCSLDIFLLLLLPFTRILYTFFHIFFLEFRFPFTYSL